MTAGFERTRVGGLLAFVGETPGPVTAGLLFRVGQADETLPRRGITHLVEHLALGGFGPGEHITGYVDLWLTVAVARGADGEVVGWLDEIVELLRRPPVDRLAAELRILDVEHGATLPNAVNVLIEQLFGATGPGLVGHDELGLRSVRPAHVTAHAARFFTAGNAALLLSRPLEGVVRIRLPAGPRRPAREPRVIGRDLPMEQELDQKRMAVGAIVESPAARVLTAVLRERAWDVVRQDHGLAYGIECGSRPLARERRLIYVTCDAEGESAATAARLMVEEIRTLAAAGPDAGLLATAQADVARGALLRPMARLTAAALDELAWGPRDAPYDILAEAHAVTARDVAEAAAQAADTLFVTVPAGTTTGLLPPAWLEADAPVEGTRHLRLPRPRNDEARDLVVGAEGLTAYGDEPFTVLFGTCVAAIRERPGGGLVLVGEDGLQVRVEPEDVEDGVRALAEVEAAIDPSLFVPAEGATPEEDAAERARRRGSWGSPRDASASTQVPVSWTRDP